MPWPIKTCPSRMRALPSPRHCLKNFTTDNFNQGSQVVHPFHLAARTCLPCAARPRCCVQPVVASTLCWGHSNRGFHCIFLEGVFSLALLSKHRPKTVPLACCPHSGPLQPSTPATSSFRTPVSLASRAVRTAKRWDSDRFRLLLSVSFPA